MCRVLTVKQKGFPSLPARTWHSMHTLQKKKKREEHQIIYIRLFDFFSPLTMWRVNIFFLFTHKWPKIFKDVKTTCVLVNPFAEHRAVWLTSFRFRYPLTLERRDIHQCPTESKNFNECRRKHGNTALTMFGWKTFCHVTSTQVRSFSVRLMSQTKNKK